MDESLSRLAENFILTLGRENFIVSFT